MALDMRVAVNKTLVDLRREISKKTSDLAALKSELARYQKVKGILNPNPTLFRRGSGDDPYSRGQWDTALRATPQSHKGDDSSGQCLRATCTLRCQRLPV